MCVRERSDLHRSDLSVLCVCETTVVIVMMYAGISLCTQQALYLFEIDISGFNVTIVIFSILYFYMSE